MNDVADFFDITASTLFMAGVIASIATNRLIFGDQYCVYKFIDLVLASAKIAAGSFNYITLVFWTSNIGIYAWMISCNHYVYVVASSLIVIGFCLFYLLMDYVRPVEDFS